MMMVKGRSFLSDISCSPSSNLRYSDNVELGGTKSAPPSPAIVLIVVGARVMLGDVVPVGEGISLFEPILRLVYQSLHVGADN